MLDVTTGGKGDCRHPSSVLCIRRDHDVDILRAAHDAPGAHGYADDYESRVCGR